MGKNLQKEKGLRGIYIKKKEANRKKMFEEKKLIKNENKQEKK